MLYYLKWTQFKYAEKETSLCEEQENSWGIDDPVVDGFTHCFCSLEKGLHTPVSLTTGLLMWLEVLIPSVKLYSWDYWN